MTTPKKKKSTPNEAEVGGTHYVDSAGVCPHCLGSIQVWDLYGQQPFLIGMLAKYVTRFRDKNGLEDLKKARHVLDKLEEVYYPDGK